MNGTVLALLLLNGLNALPQIPPQTGEGAYRIAAVQNDKAVNRRTPLAEAGKARQPVRQVMLAKRHEAASQGQR